MSGFTNFAALTQPYLYGRSGQAQDETIKTRDAMSTCLGEGSNKMFAVFFDYSGQIIATSAEVTPKGGDCKGILPKMALIQVWELY